MMNQPALLRLASLLLLLLLLLVCNTDAKMNIIASKLDVAVGEELFLLCKAGDEGDITWQKDGENIDDDEIVSKVDETSSKLLIKEAKLEDSGKYTCLCAYDSGHRDDVKATVFVYEGPSFGSTTTYHEFLEGSAGVVPCLVSGRPAVLVRWWRERQEFTPEGARVRKLPDNTLRFEAARREDAGTYTCQAQFRERPIGSQLSVSVVVNAPPKVRLREEVKKVMAGSETNATFVCLVDGLPKPNITWTMPVTFDPSRHQFNSDRSQLTIQSVTRADFGEYICTATNKIAEDSATIMLHVLEAPEVFLSAEQQSVSVGERVSVSCNVSGHPQPELHWLNKHNGRKLIQDSTSGRVRVADGVLVIEDVVPSDGGLYSCMAVSASGNASRDVAIHTQPGLPQHLSASPGPTSVLFSLKIPPVSGGTPITHYVLQWRRGAAEQWSEVKVPAAGPLAVAALKPYTSYTVRLAALNAVGLGQFSDSHSVHTQGVREPDSPVVLSDEVKVEGNSVSVPIKQIDDGGTPLLHFIVRYKQDKVGAEWTKLQLSSNTDSVSLRDLAFSSDYKLEMTAVNANGSSLPALFNFTTAEQPVRGSSMTKGSVVGIVMVIFLVLFLVVDATCCYRNRCGLLMTIAVKLFGQKIPGLKMLEEGESNTNGEVTLKSVSTPRGSFQHTGVQTVTKEGGQLKEVTCDKAPLTRHEKAQNIA